jgi:transcriptional regulator with XRE-family HTH domain
MAGTEVAEMSSVTGFGAVLRRWRRAEGWTQKMLAERSHVDQGTISALEVGRSRPTMDTVRRLAVAFKRPVAEVATEAGYLDADDPEPGELPGPLLEAWRTLVRKHPDLGPQLEAASGDPDFAGQIVDLSAALGLIIRGWIDTLDRPGEG